MADSISDQFLVLCRQNYFDRITPSNPENFSENGYRKLVAIARLFFDEGRTSEFSGFLQEPKYFVDLWTAHLLLEHSNPNKKIYKKAIDIIKDYSETPLDIAVAEQERNWLLMNSHKF